MKKIVSVLLAVMLVCVVLCPAYATVVENGGTNSAPVTGTYVPGDETDIIYKVDITWGALKYTYTDASLGEWDPDTHTYSGSTDAAWTVNSTGGDVIKIVNHSNTAIYAEVEYEAAEAFSGISGSFTDDTMELATAVNTTVAAAPTASTRLTLSGVLSETATTETTIGTVTITISGE